ncbi:MAG: NAD(P)/FAD-dependent oxidoreductase [Candidatus Kapabacteria bacterium]|nr:NAD(P)/FAD-dependent oxidoreductase [Candidatus Kapabacteria bacterium]
MLDYDVIIIGAGVVGLACAARLSVRQSVLVLERHSSFGQETSSRNSEVIHAGIYYQPGSLKAKLCVAGKEMLYDWCQNHNVNFKRLGKFIVAHDENEIQKLEQLAQNAQKNGVDDLVMMNYEQFKELEPNVFAVAALWSPSTGIIDSHGLMKSLYNEALKNGCDFAFHHEVMQIKKTSEGYAVEAYCEGDSFEVSTKFVVNAAGLDADTIAVRAGIDIQKSDYSLHYCKGHYFRLNHSKSGLIKHLIYPVPPEKHEGVGIHATIDLDGAVKFGPDIHYLDERKCDYNVTDELVEKFYKSVARYLPSLQLSDLSPDQSGIRPKLQKSGGDFRDFVICDEKDKNLPGFINLIGIESPGLTACLAIGKYVEKLLSPYSPE